MKRQLPELSEPMNENMLESLVLLDTVSEEAQLHDQTPSVQDGSSSQLAMDDDLEGIGPRQCGPPNKLQYHKMGKSPNNGYSVLTARLKFCTCHFLLLIVFSRVFGHIGSEVKVMFLFAFSFFQLR